MHACLIALSLIVGSWAQASVWTTRNQWNEDWNEAYQAYVKTWQVDFFARKSLPDGTPNPYYGIRTDCADTVYSFRAIFSYENGLPFAINDPTGSGNLISNEMSRFNSIKDQNKRFRAFLQFMYDTVATETMALDTYPVALNRDAVHPGVILKTTPMNHHSWTAKDILSIGVPDLIFNSTIGRASGSMLQERKSWPYPDWVFQGNQTPAGTAGFRDWRPLEYLKVPVWQVPGYSEEQYSIPLGQWVDVATKRLRLTRETDAAKLQRLADNACVEFTARIASVNDGVRFLNNQKGGDTCMSPDEYDTYSTPSRDQRTFDAIGDLRRAYKQMVKGGTNKKLSDNLDAKMRKIFPYIEATARQETDRMQSQSITKDSLCVFSYGAGRSIDLAEAKRRMFLGWMSNNPNDSLGYRWGEQQGPSPLAASCPTYGVWKPNLNDAN